MDRLTLWALGIVALGCGFTVAVASDWTPSHGASPSATTPAASGADSAGPELMFPPGTDATAQHDAAGKPSQLSTRPPDLPPGIPAALVSPASIPHFAAVELPAPVAPPSRPTTAVQHVTCPKAAPTAATPVEIGKPKVDQSAVREPATLAPAVSGKPASAACPEHDPTAAAAANAGKPAVICIHVEAAAEPVARPPGQSVGDMGSPSPAASVPLQPTVAIPAQQPASLLHGQRSQTPQAPIAQPAAAPVAVTAAAAAASESAPEVKPHSSQEGWPTVLASPGQTPTMAQTVRPAQPTQLPGQPDVPDSESIRSQVHRMPAMHSLDPLPLPEISNESPAAAAPAASPLGAVPRLPEKLQITPAHLAGTMPTSPVAQPTTLAAEPVASVPTPDTARDLPGAQERKAPVPAAAAEATISVAAPARVPATRPLAPVGTVPDVVSSPPMDHPWEPAPAKLPAAFSATNGAMPPMVAPVPDTATPVPAETKPAATPARVPAVSPGHVSVTPSAATASQAAPATPHAPTVIPVSATIQPAGIPVRPTGQTQPLSGTPLGSKPSSGDPHDDSFVGPVLHQKVLFASTSIVMAAQADAVAPQAAAPQAAAPQIGATVADKETPAGDDWQLGEWCHDIWGEFSNWATREPVVCASVGMDILKPFWKSNPAFLTGNFTGTATARITDFDYGMQVVPQFTLGAIVADNVGFRFGWWGFAAQNSAFSGISGAGLTAAPLGVALPSTAGEGIAAASKLRFDVWDFEAFEVFHPCQWSLLLSGGIRYAHLSQDYAAEVVDSSGTVSALLSGNNFNGAGPTLALWGKRSLGCSNLYLYANLRGSILFGDGHDSVSAPSFGVGDVILRSNDLLPEAEIELGLGSYRTLGQAQFFAQAGLIAQAWIDAGNSSRSEITPVVGSQSDSTLGLLGLSMHVGVNY